MLTHMQLRLCAHGAEVALVHTDVILLHDDSRFHAAALSSSKVLNGAWKKKKICLSVRVCVLSAAEGLKVRMCGRENIQTPLSD